MTNQLTNKTLLGAAALGLLLLSGSASAAIKNTKHYLGASTSTNSNSVASTTTGSTNTAVTDPTNPLQGEICVFCHTPHGADDSASVPLWNKALPSPSYSTYADVGSSSLDSQVAEIGSVSIACLSCHDGTQAMDNMMNEPGSGFDTIDTFTWNTSSRINGGKLKGDAAVGLDGLANDHPVGIQYAGGFSGTPSYNNNRTDDFVDTDFKSLTKDSGRDSWWVDTEAAPNGTRQKTDMILYTRNMTGLKQEDGVNDFSGTGNAAFVECASCHDPHTENATFLRMDGGNKNSQICLACHTK